MIVEVFASGPAQTNSYLLACSETKQAAVIDVPLDSAEHTLRRIQTLSLQPQEILLTHSHWDHTAEVALLKKRLSVPVLVHAEDAPNVEHPGADKLSLFFPIQGVKPDGFLTEGQILPLGTLRIEVIHTPGHTPGGVCFYLAKEHVLFSGDTLFQGTIGNLSLPTARPEEMWRSLKRLSQLPPETVVYPGHGEATTIGQERWIAQAKARFGGPSP